MRKFALILCAAFLLSVLLAGCYSSMQEGAKTEPSKLRSMYDYKYKPMDQKSAEKSTGTGGTEWISTYKDYSSYIYDYAADDTIASVLPYKVQGRIFGNLIRAENMENTALMEEINNFLADTEKKIIYDADNCENGILRGQLRIMEGCEFTGEVGSINLQTYLYNDENECISEGRDLSATFDFEKGKRLALSDFFYNGFNYLDYINKDILSQLNKKLQVDFAYEETPQKRPFTGIAQDYPYFKYRYGNIQLYFPDENPFFNNFYGNITEFDIHLSNKICPYASQYGEYPSVSYEEMKISNSLSVMLPSVSLPISTDISARVNGEIAHWVHQFVDTPDELNRFIKKYSKYLVDSDGWVRFDPEIEQRGRYLSVTYGRGLNSGDISHITVFKTISFDLETGDMVDLATLIPKKYDWGQIYLLPFSTLPRGTTFKNAYLMNPSLLYVNIVTKNGKEYYAVIDLDDLSSSE